MLLALVATSAASPALVTAARGAVSLVAETETQPAAPYVLDDAHALRVPDGAVAVVLFEGRAIQVTGPALVKTAELVGAGQATGQEPSVLAGLIERGTSTKQAGATRAGGTTLSRPLQGAKVATVPTFSWSCGDCGEVAIELASFLDDEVVWISAGTNTVAYDGPALEPGPYAVKVGGQEFSFRVTDSSAQDQVAAIVAGAGISDPVLAAEVGAGLYAQAGLLSEALWTLDAARAEHDSDELEALTRELEKRAGLE
ncbi:MAG: hypothetical protein GY913_24425 [Proteobacteria bacterium]|nr:hypothetical protein [Pseudomonadota bacterium]